MLETTFLNGLNPTIKAKVVSKQLVWLEDIMKQAQLIEDRDPTVKMAIEQMGSGPPRDTSKSAQ